MGKFKTFAKYLALFAGAIGGGLGIGWAATDGVDAYYKSQDNGLALLAPHVHLKKGTHRVVISDQFYEMLTFETEKTDQDLAINGIKKAYENLNEHLWGINFELCTTANGLDEYGIKKVDTINKEDLPLYMTTEIIDNNKNVLAKTDWDYNYFGRELKEESITFRKTPLFTVYKIYKTDEETMNPLNTYAYTITTHETLHALGLPHTESKDSIMYPYISLSSPKDLTEKDIEILKTYCTTFYGEKTAENSSSKLEEEITL